MNQAKFELFRVAYSVNYLKAVKANPDKYFSPKNETVEVAVSKAADRMLNGIATDPKMVNYAGDSFKLTCKELGIKYTRKAIWEYLEITA